MTVDMKMSKVCLHNLYSLELNPSLSNCSKAELHSSERGQQSILDLLKPLDQISDMHNILKQTLGKSWALALKNLVYWLSFNEISKIS